MQTNFGTSMFGFNLVEGYIGIPVQNQSVGGDKSSSENNHVMPKSVFAQASTSRSGSTNNSLSDMLRPFGLPAADNIEPTIDPHLRPLNYVDTLASIHCLLMDSTASAKPNLHLYQYAVFHGLSNPKLLRRSLLSARQHASVVHDKVVTSAWLRFERREDELDGVSSTDCGWRTLECPKSTLLSGYDPDSVYECCSCPRPSSTQQQEDECSTSTVEDDEEGDIALCIGDEEVVCIRRNIAALSRPFHMMLYGGFKETRREKINFSQNGISVEGMRAVSEFSKAGRVESFPLGTVLELLAFADQFCCDGMKSACDRYLASIVNSLEDALLLVEYGLEGRAYLLVAACLQVFLRELPQSLKSPDMRKVFCSPNGKGRLAAVGHASFLLYYFLSQVAMEEDMQSNTLVMLLERLGECAVEEWQKQLALHQLGCVMLERKEYKDALHYFEAAYEAGHVYSLAGVSRSKYKRGHKYAAYKQMDTLISECKPLGWMYQERSLYCVGEEKMMDLDTATEMDPTLSYPYKYRAIMLLDEKKISEAITEINRILGFKVSPDCLELRAWLYLAQEDYESALWDIRAMLTLDPNYMMFHHKVHGQQLVDILCQHVQQWSLADCWMQLYDRWSSVDDIGSLAVVHQMLETEQKKSVLQFRQSLLLLRLNCQKAAMRSLRLARNESSSEHEKLVYEGWILYDTGHREEALAKAEESISNHRSFEAFFLKAYALADASLDPASSSDVIQLLAEALKCPSDGLRKGQALNNLGSVYVDCDKLELATNCYLSALHIRHTRAHQGLARVYHLQNHRKAAYDEMTKLIEKARNNASAYEKRSEYCDRDMAKNDLLLATQLDPLRTYPYRYRAAVLMDDRKEEEAILELSKAISFKPDIQLLHLRAAFHDSVGDVPSTLRDCEAALCLDPNHNDTLDLYNKALEKSNHQKQ